MCKLIIAHSQYFVFLINAGERETKNQGVKCERGYRWTGDPWLPCTTTWQQAISSPWSPAPTGVRGEEGGAGEGVLHLMRKDIDDHIKARCLKRSYECHTAKSEGRMPVSPSNMTWCAIKRKSPVPMLPVVREARENAAEPDQQLQKHGGAV